MKKEDTENPKPSEMASGFFMPFFPSLDTLAGERCGLRPRRAPSGEALKAGGPSVRGGRPPRILLSIDKGNAWSAIYATPKFSLGVL